MSQSNEKISVIAMPQEAVPKLATAVIVSKVKKSIVITFIYKPPDEQPILIDRIVLEAKLADDLADLIQAA